MILFAQSHFSLMESLLSPLEICTIAKKDGFDAVCLLDKNSLYGTPELLKHAKKNTIKPIIGAYLFDKLDSIAAIPISSIGYRNLCHLITGIHRQPNYQIRAQNDLLKELVFITDNLETALFFQSISLPIHWALHTPYKIPPIQVKQNKIPLLAVHLANLQSSAEHETRVLMNSVRNNKLFSNKDSTLSRPLYPKEKLIELFTPFPDAIQQNQILQNQIQYTHKIQTIFPTYTPPSDLTPQSYLKQLTYEGACKRYGTVTHLIKERIDYELQIIHSKQFDGYFLVVHEIVQKASRTCGRGSGSGSVVSYCLGITNVDPIRFHLLFERFLSPDRIDYPDLDIDFAWDERDAILEFVQKRFGVENCAMVCNHIYFKPRMALRVTAKAHGYPDHTIKTFSKTAREIIKRNSHHLSKLEKTALLIAKRALKLIDHPRHISLHCGGIVITPSPIQNFVPLQNSSKELPLIQWEKDGAEEMGLVKIDLLGNRSLAVIRDAIANCLENGYSIDYTQTDPSLDAETISMLAKGDTMGVFYIESPATRLLQKRSMKGDFEHIIIHSSIIRPASNNSIREYTRRVRGGTWQAIHPLYEKITEDAYGIMVYEDHVLSVTHELASFTYHEANQLRKALSRDDATTLQKIKEKFYQGIAEHEARQPCC